MNVDFDNLCMSSFCITTTLQVYLRLIQPLNHSVYRTLILQVKVARARG